MTTINQNAQPDVPKLSDAQLSSIAKAQNHLADTLADKVTPAMNTAVATAIRAKKEWQGGPFVLLMMAKDVYSDNLLKSFPVPGMEVGTNPDKYKVPYFRDGKQKFKATSFYAEFFKRTVAGKAIEDQLIQIAVAKDEKSNKTGLPNDILVLDPVNLNVREEDLKAERNVAVAAWRTAMALYHQFEGVNALKDVEAYPFMNTDGTVQKVSKPIYVGSVSNPKQEWGTYSISGFMAFDPAKAAEGENGGTLAALKLTAKREQEQAGEQGGDKPIAINTNATFVARLNDVAEYIGNKMMEDKKREVYGLFLKEQVNGAGSDDLIYNLEELRLWATGILNIPAVQTRLEIINQKKNAA